MTGALKACPRCGYIRSDFAGMDTHSCEAVSHLSTTPSATAMQQALETLRKAAGWFDDYERQHRAKRTTASELKADTNAERAAYLRAAIPALEAAMQPGEGEVERVARAIYEAQCEIRPGYKMDIELLSLDGRDEWRSIARAAIAAMKGEG
jgi:hypothetical protein